MRPAGERERFDFDGRRQRLLQSAIIKRARPERGDCQVVRLGRVRLRFAEFPGS